LPQRFLFTNEAHVKIPSAVVQLGRILGWRVFSPQSPTSSRVVAPAAGDQGKAGASAVSAGAWRDHYAELWTVEWFAVHVTFKAIGVSDRLFLGSEGLWSDGAHCRLPVRGGNGIGGTLLAETRLPGDAEAFAGRGGDPFQSLAGRAGRGEWRKRLIHVDLDDLFAASEAEKDK